MSQGGTVAIDPVANRGAAALQFVRGDLDPSTIRGGVVEVEELTVDHHVDITTRFDVDPGSVPSAVEVESAAVLHPSWVGVATSGRTVIAGRGR